MRWESVGFHIQQRIQSRILFLGLELPDCIACHCDVPPDRPQHIVPDTIPMPLMWQLTIAILASLLVGIVWSDSMIFWFGVSIAEWTIIDLVPLHVTQLCFELDDFLLKMFKSPLLSTWSSRLQARRLHDMLHALKKIKSSSSSAHVFFEMDLTQVEI